MNKISVPGAGAVRRLSQRVVVPAIPKVKAGFKTLYVQCSPGRIKQSMPTMPKLKMPRVPQMPRVHLPTIHLPKLPSFPRPQIRVPQLPKVDWAALRLSASRAIRRNLNFIRFIENATFVAAHMLGRINGLRSTQENTTLFVTTASLPEAVLLEPMLRSLAARHPDRTLHVWAHEQICAYYAAAPFIAKLRTLRRPPRNGYSVLAEIRKIFTLAFRLGSCRFDAILCDPRADGVLADAFTRGARTESLWILDRSGTNREEITTGRRTTRYLAFDGSVRDILGAFNGVAQEWRSRVFDEPRVYPADTAAQLAHSRSRGWRSQANSLGATSLVAICPCSEPVDVSIGLGLWSQVIRELWSRHNALPILFSEGPDVAAVEQVSSLLGEVPHIRLTGADDILERASLIGKVDAVIAAAGAWGQVALAQNIPTVIAGSEYRRRWFAWASNKSPYLLADGTGKLTSTEILRAYQRLFPKPAIRVAS